MLESLSSVSYGQIKGVFCFPLVNEYENDVTKHHGGNFSKFTGLVNRAKDFNF